MNKFFEKNNCGICGDCNFNCDILNEELNSNQNWDILCNYLGNEIANGNDCENGCLSEFLAKVNEIKKYSGFYDKQLEQLRTENKRLEKALCELKQWAAHYNWMMISGNPKGDVPYIAYSDLLYKIDELQQAATAEADKKGE